MRNSRAGMAAIIHHLVFPFWWQSSPYINRFLSADTIVPDYANPQSLNRYSYVLNNPMRYTDPTGHWADEGCGTGGPGSPSGGTGCNLPIPNSNDDGDDDDGGLGGLPEINSREFCDPILGCENPDAGVFCDQVSCWRDAGTDVSWTLEDWPAITVSVAAPCFLTGLCQTMGWAGLYACLRITACARAVASTTGITVYRVWGGTAGPVGGSPITRPGSWTPINPLTVVNYANKAGLPPGNTAQYLSVGTIYSMENVSIVTAAEIGPNAGGLLEYSITNPQIQVFVQEILYLFK